VTACGADELDVETDSPRTRTVDQGSAHYPACSLQRSFTCQDDQASPVQPTPNVKMTTVCAGHRLGGAPRRNRTGDPILTMEPPGTAVRTAITPGHARPSRPKLSVLPPCSYALTFKPGAGRLAGVVAAPLEAPGHHRWMRRGAGWNTAATARVAPATARPEVLAGVGQAVGLPCRSHHPAGP
jgi:hypothetical protein